MNLSSHNFVKRLVRLEEVESYSRDRMFRAPGSCVLATVTEVADPEKRGRVKVVYEHLDPDSEGNTGNQAFESGWLNVSPPFEGVQPESLVGEKVLVQLKDGDYNRGYLSDVVSLQEPTNRLIRLPVYAKGELPAASAMNLGCMAIEKDQPPGSHSFVVVVKKNGKYLWAGSSHSLMELTPLTTAAKEVVQRAAAQNAIFSSSAEKIMSGEAFSPIKNKKERAILTAINQAVLSVVESPIKAVLKPIEDVDISFLENSFSRYSEVIPSVSTVSDGIEKFAELVSGEPRQILSGLNSLRELLGGAFNDVLKITKDVTQYLGSDTIQSALTEAERFGTQVLDRFPEIVKDMPRLLGVEVKRIVGEEIGSEIQVFQNNLSNFSLSSLGIEVDSIEKFVDDKIFKSLTLLDSLSEKVESFLPESIESLLPFPDVIQSLVNGSGKELEYKFSQEDTILTVFDKNIPVINATVSVADNTLTFNTWSNAGDLRSAVLELSQRFEFDIFVKGEQVSGFFPSLGFELFDKERNLWQYRR